MMRHYASAIWRSLNPMRVLPTTATTSLCFAPLRNCASFTNASESDDDVISIPSTTKLAQRPIGTRDVSCQGIDVPALLSECTFDETVSLLKRALSYGVSMFDVCHYNNSTKACLAVKSALSTHIPNPSLNTNERIIVSAHIGVGKDGVLDCSPEALEHDSMVVRNALRDVNADILLNVAGRDPNVVWVDTLYALKAELEHDSIQMIGVSDVDFKSLQTAIDKAPISSVRHQLSLACRHILENGVLSLCDDYNLALLAHTPFGPVDRIGNVQHCPQLREVAKKHNTSPLQICLSWLLISSCVIPLSPLSSLRNEFTQVEFDSSDLEMFEKLQYEF